LIPVEKSADLNELMIELLVPFLLLVLALGLLVAEDLLPTGGALGLLAVGCLGLVLYLGFSRSFAIGCRYLVFEIVMVPGWIWAWWSLMSRTKLGRLAYLQPPEPHEVEVASERVELSRLIGLQGRALTSLRPSGMVDFEGRRLDGMAEEGLIATGSPILAVRVQSGRLIVRALTESATEDSC